MYPDPIQKLIRAFSRLPSVGQRTAERFVFYLLKSGKKDVAELTLALKNLIEQIKSCEQCWDFSDTSPCALCADDKKDQSILCIVQEPQDMRAIKKTDTFNGRYHILRGLIRPNFEQRVSTHIKIKELFIRLQKEPQIKEIILALDPTLEGETTAMYIEKYIKKHHTALKLTRLARGLPMGSDLQYADEITLGSALRNRTVV